MATEKQIEANRRNAQKSTGPKTEEGKQKSRRNALKHGLTGEGIVLKRRDQKKLAKTVNEWRDILAPVNALEEKLVERSALATIRLERAVKQSEAERRDRVHRALKQFEGRLQREVGRTAKELPNDPDAAIRKLKSSARGVSWLLEEWRKLRDLLEANGFWSDENAAVALRLLGKRPCGAYPDDPSVTAFRRAFLGALPELDPEGAAKFLGLENPADDSPERLAHINAELPEPAAAREALRAIAAEEVSALEALQAALSDDLHERAERSHVIDRVQVDTSLPSYRLHRYELDHELSMHRNLNELIRIRKQEPELASIARWEKTGKKYNRRWDGYAWVPNAEWRVPEAGEELKRMTDGGWLMTEQTADSGSDRVNHPSSVISHSSPAPVSHPSSVISHPGASPAVWPGLSETCPGLPQNNPRLEEAAGLVALGPVTATGGSLCSTPGTRSGSQPEEQEADLPADDDVKVSGASLRSAPGTRSESDPEEGKSGLVGDGHGKVSGSSLCSAPGTRSEADERPDSPQAQARTRVAGFSAWREPGASAPTQEPADRPQSSHATLPQNKPNLPRQTPEPQSGWIDRQHPEDHGMANHKEHEGHQEDGNGVWPGRRETESGDRPARGQPDRESHNGHLPAEREPCPAHRESE